jgi:hypothetical protein
MNVDWQIYLVGTSFAIIAGGLVSFGEPVWALFPAAAAVYLLGCVLYEKLFSKS